MPGERYNRQILLHSFGEEGQGMLRRASVAIVGLGALGTHHAETLARMGVGKLILIDRDIVELDNLNRQALFDEDDAYHNLLKAEAASEHLKAINCEITTEVFPKHLGPGNINSLLKNAGIILDGTDNFITRYLLNDYAGKMHLPYIYCGVVGYEAITFPILPDGPCLRCLFRDMPDPSSEPTCDTTGVWPPAVGIISGFAVDIGLRWILNLPPDNGWPILTIDLASGIVKRRSIAGLTDPACPTCNGHYDFLGMEDVDTVQLCGSGAYQVIGKWQDIDFGDVTAKLGSSVTVITKPFGLFIDVGSGETITLFRDGRAIIRGVDDARRAKTLYDKFIGS